MPGIETVTHRAAISGYVNDAASGTGIAGAVVELVSKGLQTSTRPDGFYFFLDLPGGSYTLHASAPSLGNRYGTVTISGVTVASDSAGRPLLDPKGHLGLPPTGLSGAVRRNDTLAPIPFADVRLRASNVTGKSDQTGHYELTAVEAGKQTVQVSASGFNPVTQSVTLNVGSNTVVDFRLSPI